MQLKALKQYFLNSLLGYYPQEEIASFFYIASEFFLGYKRIDVSLNEEKLIEGNNYNEFQEVIERLKTYEPIQYILGETEFYGLPFKVDKGVLIPRPETEELVDWIITCHSELVEESKEKQINILDIGTGSGCIAISLAKHMPNAKVFALDVSEEALDVARSNAKENDADITFIKADILNLKEELKNKQFDVIVSNPPYVRMLEKEMMQDNVLKYEPHLALFVENNDALLFYREITMLSKKVLKDQGLLFFEINEFLGDATCSLLEEHGFQNIELRKDISQKDRMIKATKI